MTEMNRVSFIWFHGDKTIGNGCRIFLFSLVFASAVLLIGATALAQDPVAVERFTAHCAYSSSMFDRETLVRNWRAADLPGIPKDRVSSIVPVSPPGKNDSSPRTAVEAVRSSADAPLYQLDLGSLGIGCYVVRVIAMVKPDDVETYRKPLFMDLRVKMAAGKEQFHRQRIPYLSDFYAVAELYFLVDSPGAHSASIQVGAGSSVDLYIHNIELHDVLKGLPQKAAKTGSGLFTAEERAVLRGNVNPVEAQASVAKWVKPMDPLWSDAKKTLSGDERAARDRMLWDSFPPVNSQHTGWYPTAFPTKEITIPVAPEAQKAFAEFGTWEGNERKLEPLALSNAKLKLTYSQDDFANHRPLPAPYPIKDDGGGVYFPKTGEMEHAQNLVILAPLLTSRWTTLAGTLATWDGDDITHRVPYLYHALGNENAARDAALLLCRWAYLYPTISDAMVINGSLIAPAGIYNRDLRLASRFINEGLDGLQQGLATSYDYLFDYIKGNQELAQAVGRFIPWIKTDEDVRRLIETRILQFGARQVMHFNVFNDKGTPGFLMRLAAIQQDQEITSPWLEYLWSRAWIYPHARAGLPDYLSTTTQRDGSTDIGALFYTQSGTPFLDLALAAGRYVRNGGDPKYDLSDVKAYRKVAEACRFPLRTSVAGYPLSIGDVGGLSKPRLFNGLQTEMEKNCRAGAQLIGDPALAWIVVNYFGRGGESDPEWAVVTDAASRQKGNPFLGQASRVMPNWAGILETGGEAQDFRFLRAAILRVGTGHGHAHDDTLDLQLFAHGVRAANDVGWRSGYSAPHPNFSQLHNLVEIDEKNWQGHAWIPILAPVTGVQYMMGIAVPPVSHGNVGLRTRELAMVDVDSGKPGTRPPTPLPYGEKTRFDPSAVTPNSYFFDVERVSGGNVHTYCFHGTVSDDFQINSDKSGEVSNELEINYLRRFMQGKGMKTSGIAPDVLSATWRLRRNEEKVNALDRDGKPVTLQLPNMEAHMQGGSYDQATPMKYTRVHLLGHKGDRVLTASPSTTENNPEKITWPFLFVQKRGTNLQSVYTAIIEPYSGEPFISSVRQVTVEPNEADAQQAVAVEVKTKNGHTDLCISDGRGVLRKIGGVMSVARFAYLSRDERGLRLASMVEGTELVAPEGTLKMDRSKWTGTVSRVDYWERKVWISGDWTNAKLVGEQVEFGNDRHRTSYCVESVVQDGNQTVLVLDKAIDLSYAHVISSDPERKLVTVNIGPVRLDPGMVDGLSCTNADNNRQWKCSIKGGDSGNYTYRLEGTFTAQDFPVGGIFRLWEFGNGDTVRLAARATVRRTADGKMQVESNGNATWTPQNK